MIIIRDKRIVFNLTDALGVLILFGTAIVNGGPAGMDPGIGWHLATGRWIERFTAFPSHQLFLLPDIAQSPWISDQWLADLVFYEIYRLGGLFFLHMVISGSMLWLVIFPLRRRVVQNATSQTGSFLALFIVTMLLSVQWILRPFIFSFLFFAIVYFFIADRDLEHSGDRAVEGYSWKNFLFIGALFAIWANTHPGFTLGLVLLGVNALFTAIQALPRIGGQVDTGTPNSTSITTVVQSIGILFTALLFTLINPYGLDLYRSIIQLAGNPYFTNLNQEWHSPNLIEPGFQIMLWIAGAILLLTSTRSHKLLSGKELFLLTLFLFLGLTSIRFLSFLAIIVALPLAKCIDNSLPSILSASTTARRIAQITTFSSCPYMSCLLWIALSGYALLNGELPIRSPIDGVQLANAKDQEVLELISHLPDDTRLFHSPNYGGLIAWNLWPHLRGFIDDRNQVVEDRHYQIYFNIVGGLNNWEKLVEQYRFNALLIEPADSLRWVVSDEWKCKASKSGYQLCRAR